MSRIGKRPVEIPSGVTVEVKENTVAVKGPKGELRRTLPHEMGVALENGTVTVSRPSDASRPSVARSIQPTHE